MKVDEVPGKRLRGNPEYVFSLIQDEIEVARVSGPNRAQAKLAMDHYAFVYGQDGPVEIREYLID